MWREIQLKLSSNSKIGICSERSKSSNVCSYEIVGVKGLAYAYFCILAYVATIVHLFVLLRFYTF